MKGKYANKAQKRREVTAAEENAAAAATARAAAEETLNEYQAKAESTIARLKERLSIALADRDAMTAPRITELESQVEAMRQQSVKSREELREVKKKWHKIIDATLAYIKDREGLTDVEAYEYLLKMFGGDDRLVIGFSTLGNYAGESEDIKRERELTIGKARGWRRPQHSPEDSTAAAE